MKKFIATLLAAAVVLPVMAADKDKKADAKKAKPYTLETCIVSDEKLGSMGDPYVFVHEGQEIKMCCKSCKKSFDKDTKKHLKKLEKDSKKK